MSGIKIVRRVVVTMTIAATLVGAVPAQAAVASHITATYTSNFNGKITSASSHCISHRTVKLFRHRASGNTLMGSTTSTSGGLWSISLAMAHGKYFARMPAQTKQGTLCSAEQSNAVSV
jgi:hypothetical protein